MRKRISVNKIFLIGLIVLFLVASSFLFLLGSAYGADEGGQEKCSGNKINLQVPLPGIGSCVSGFPAYIIGVYELFITAVGILAVIMIMLGGFQWLLAGGNAQKIGGAKTTIISAILGLVLALGSYTILNLANPAIKSLKLDIKKVNLEEGGDSGIGLCKNKGEDNYLLKNGERVNNPPECGQKYTYLQSKEDKNEICLGFIFKGKDEICQWNYNETTEVNSIFIIDNRSNGFGHATWQARWVHPDNPDSFFRDGEADKGRECGNLYVSKYSHKYEETYAYAITTLCEDESYCVIGTDSKVEWNDKVPDEMEEGKPLNNYDYVGKVITEDNSGCKSY